MSVKQRTVVSVVVFSLLAVAAAAPRAAEDSVAANLSAEVGEHERAHSRSCGTVDGVSVCAWVETEAGSVLEMGADIPLELVESVPTDAEMVWPPRPLLEVTLPREVRSTLGIDHMTINWEAHGHPPMTFLAPHFDFHFYSIGSDDVRDIDCSDTRKPSGLPEGFTLPDLEVPGLGTLVGVCVPEMGMHAMVERDAVESEPFDASMMLGYYGGEPIFFEPMVARDRLLERSDFTLAMPAIHGLPEGVHYPTRFEAVYEEEGDLYRLRFSRFGRG